MGGEGPGVDLSPERNRGSDFQSVAKKQPSGSPRGNGGAAHHLSTPLENVALKGYVRDRDMLIYKCFIYIWSP